LPNLSARGNRAVPVATRRGEVMELTKQNKCAMMRVLRSTMARFFVPVSTTLYGWAKSPTLYRASESVPVDLSNHWQRW